MHDRVVQLERLVMSLLPTSVASPTPELNAMPNRDPAPSAGATTVTRMGAARATFSPTEAATLTTDSDSLVPGDSECGSMRVGPSELHYVGGDHWAAILDGIADLKDHLEREEQLHLSQDGSEDAERAEPGVPKPQSSHSLLLYGSPLPSSRAEVLAALPPRTAADRYISRYFNRLDLVHCQCFPPCRYLDRCCRLYAEDMRLIN